jgi:inorganic pyrophosphatase
MPSLLSSCLPAMDPQTDDITAVIETPKGSPNKYDYDPGCAAFRLAGVLPEGSTFPYDFGFIPSTLGDDREEGGQWVRNDRLLAVATHAHTHGHVQNLDDLRPRLLDEIETFFVTYNKLKGKIFEVLDRSGPKKARKLVEHGMTAFRTGRTNNGR